MNETQIIKNWLDQHNIKYSAGQINGLMEYIDSVREFSLKLNLVSKNDLPHIIERHLLDSLQAFNVYEFKRDSKVGDIGSGAGFPGIPIAIMRPDIQMFLIESRRKRSLFLSGVINQIGLANAMVLNERWEDTTILFDVLLARAVFPETEIINKSTPHLNPGGTILYYAKFNNIKVLKP